MDAAWIVLGVIVLLLTLLDTFLAVLNYDEGGLFVDKIVRGQWVVMRAVTRRVGRRWRPLVLRQVTGILLVTNIFWWLLGIILGFALIYFGAMGLGGFQISTGVEADFWGAFYLSTGQFSTVGVDNISPQNPVLNLLTVSEAMVSIVLLSFIITFLGSVYGVIQSLRALSANFFRIGPGVGDPLDTLTPFFADGEPRGLDDQLSSISDDLSAYAQGLAQNRAAYYFQSGRDQFSLPFALYMTGGVIGALQWGLPAGSDIPTEPNLARLGQVFEDFRLRTQRMLGMHSATGRPPVPPEEFAAAAAAFASASPSGDVRTDAWVLRFLTIDRRMASLTQRSAQPDPDERYRRYVAWLPFELQTRTFIAQVSKDLDFQPIYRGVAATPDGIALASDDVATLPAPVGPAETAPVPVRPRSLRTWARRRMTRRDPGLVRLAGAIRTLLAAGAAVAIVVPLATLADLDASTAAVFAGLISLYSARAVVASRASGKWWMGAMTAFPALIGAACGVLIPRTPVSAVFELAIVAGIAMWLRRFGPSLGGLGQLAFVTYYVTVLLGMTSADLASVLVAAAVGVLAAFIVGSIPGPSLARRVREGVDALYERVAALVDKTVDLLSTGREDARLIRSLRAELSDLVQTANVLAGGLNGDDTPRISPARARALRVRIFDLQLAAQSLVMLLPLMSSIAISVDQRARLAADLLDVERQLVSYVTQDAASSAPMTPTISSTHAGEDRAGWPLVALRIDAMITELRDAIARLRAAQTRDEDELVREEQEHRRPEGEAPRTTPAAAGGGAGGADAGRGHAARANDRQAVQAAISTGLALFLGGFVSSTHQYWAAMPAFQVLAGSDGETRSKAFIRIVATLAASFLAFGLAIVADHSIVVAAPLLVISAFAMSYMATVSSAWLTFWMTLLLATVYDLLGTLSVETVEVRLAETAIGSIVAVVASALVFPTRTRTRVLTGMTGVVDRAAALSASLFARIQGEQAPQAARLSESLRALDKQLTDLEKVAHPIRRNPGSLQPTGIQAQLTCLWAMADHEGHVVRLLRNFPADAPNDTWRMLGDATAENFEAVRTLLSGSLPRSIHLPLQLEQEAGALPTERERALLLQMLRLNQTLLALLDAIAPGTVDSMTDDASRHAAAGDLQASALPD